MTHTIPTLLLLPSLLFVAAGLLAGAIAWRRLRPFRPEGAMVLGAIGLLTLAPIAMLVSYGFSGELSFLAGGLHLVIAMVVLGAARRAQIFSDRPDTASTWSFREKSAPSGSVRWS